MQRVVKGDIFIFPSSIHELLFLKDDGTMSVARMEKIVSDINRTKIKENERLTDHVYHYDATEKVFELGSKYEARKAMREAQRGKTMSRNRESVLGELRERQQTPMQEHKPVRGKSGKDLER